MHLRDILRIDSQLDKSLLHKLIQPSPRVNLCTKQLKEHIAFRKILCAQPHVLDAIGEN